MKRSIAILIAALLLLGMIIPAALAADYTPGLGSWDVGAAQGSIRNAVQQQITRNPNWIFECIARWFAGLH